MLTGGPIYLCRAELGRATWKYFHTVMARFPEKPTQDEQDALRTYIHLFARLYPWYDHDSLNFVSLLLRARLKLARGLAAFA